MKSRSFSGATAVSSTNEMLLASPFIAMDRPSEDCRSCHTLAWSAAASARDVPNATLRESRSRSRASRRSGSSVASSA